MPAEHYETATANPGETRSLDGYRPVVIKPGDKIIFEAEGPMSAELVSLLTAKLHLFVLMDYDVVACERCHKVWFSK